jgi:YlmC/YmxH family sporulation protein
MRLKDIAEKEIVDVSEGIRLGILGQTDLEINEQTGQIEAFIIPSFKWFGIKKDDEELKIRWSSIKKIGEDMILVKNDSFS